MPRDDQPVRRGMPLERAESHIDRRSGLGQPPHERRKRRNLELSPQVVNQTPDVTAIAGTHNHTGVYSPIGHTHLSGSITDFTEAAQDAALAVIADSASVDWTYNDGANTASAAVIPNTSIQKITHRKNSGSDVGSRQRVNWIEGANITLTVTDDAGSDEVDVTITGAAGGGGGGAPGGMVILREQVFSGVASVSLDSVFTSQYENYRVEISGFSSSAAMNLTARLRVGGVDASGATDYQWGREGWTTGAFAATGSTGASSWTWLYTAASGTFSDAHVALDLSRPALAARTLFSELVAARITSPAMNSELIAGFHTLATAYDGLSLIASAGTISGTIRVYGYINSVGALAAGPADSPHLIQKQTFTGQTSVSFNNVFTSKYKNYRVVVSNLTGSGAADFRMFMRAAGVDNTGALYYYAGWGVTSGGATGVRAGSAVTTGFRVCNILQVWLMSGYTIDVFNPAVAVRTWFNSQGGAIYAGTLIGETTNGSHDSAVVYDGCTFSPTTGTISGEISIFGIPDSVAAVNEAEGLILLNSQSFTGVTEVIWDGIFTSDYDDYLLLVDLPASVAELYIQLRAAGVNSATNYYYAGTFSYANSTGSHNGFSSNTVMPLGTQGLTTSGAPLSTECVIKSPFRATYTSFGIGTTEFHSDAANFKAWLARGMHNINAARDGVRLYPPSGTITGRAAIYGYRK